MPKRKPHGWPDYMEAKVAGGVTRYYWNAPSWARKRGCPIKSEALGADYAAAKSRCDEVLNPIFASWRTGGATDDAVGRRVIAGTVDWAFAAFKKSPKYTGRPARTRQSIDYALSVVADHVLKDGRRFGEIAVKSVLPATADRLYEKLKIGKNGRQRLRTAQLAMVYAKRAFDVARRAHPAAIPELNPFAKMDTGYQAKPTAPATREQLDQFVMAADRAGRASLGTAAMVAFYWLQREEDIFLRFAWGDYQPTKAPDKVLVWHHKNRGERIELPLTDVDGTELWPEMTTRIGITPRVGTLIVMRDAVDKRRKIHLPWATGGANSMRYVQAETRRICRLAGLPEGITFTSFRHGGHTDGADAELTDAQMRALGAHKTTAALLRYAKETEQQRRIGARKRLNARTKKGNLSE